jgi:hypothetical protein
VDLGLADLRMSAISSCIVELLAISPTISLNDGAASLGNLTDSSLSNNYNHNAWPNGSSLYQEFLLSND